MEDVKSIGLFHEHAQVQNKVPLESSQTVVSVKLNSVKSDKL